MIRRLLCLFLVFSLTLVISPKREPIPEAHAIAIVLAPGVAIGICELVLGALVLAAAVGIISAQQKQGYDAEINGMIASMQEAMRRGLDATGEIVTRSLVRLSQINGSLGIFAISCTALMAVNANASSSSTTESRTTTAVGECDPSLRGSPYDCCPDFMRRFGGDRTPMTAVGRFAYRIRYIARHAITRECCFEWDSMHGRFEVYERGNHEPIKHLGEKSCARDQDLDENLCAPTFPEKADLFSRRHAPRNGCP